MLFPTPEGPESTKGRAKSGNLGIGVEQDSESVHVGLESGKRIDRRDTVGLDIFIFEFPHSSATPSSSLQHMLQNPTTLSAPILTLLSWVLFAVVHTSVFPSSPCR